MQSERKSQERCLLSAADSIDYARNDMMTKIEEPLKRHLMIVNIMKNKKQAETKKICLVYVSIVLSYHAINYVR